MGWRGGISGLGVHSKRTRARSSLAGESPPCGSLATPSDLAPKHSHPEICTSRFLNVLDDWRDCFHIEDVTQAPAENPSANHETNARSALASPPAILKKVPPALKERVTDGTGNSRVGITLGRRKFQKDATPLQQQNPHTFLIKQYTNESIFVNCYMPRLLCNKKAVCRGAHSGRRFYLGRGTRTCYSIVDDQLLSWSS